MSNILTPVIPTKAPAIQSFGAGGQMYVADLWTGFNITSDRDNELFAFSRTERNVANARMLTNLTEPRKIGSTMTFKATQIGLRVIKTKDGILTPAEVTAMKDLLNSSVIKLNYGSNDTVIAEFTGMHLTNPVDFFTADATNNSSCASGAINPAGFIRLPEPIGMQDNVNIGGSVHFGRPVPSALTGEGGVAAGFAFVVLLSGLKVVKS